MKALVKKHAREGLWLEDVPIPTINDNEVLVKVRKTAICGTDTHIYKWDKWAENTIPTPMVVGHEFMGTIAEVGSNVKDLEIGERVTAEGHVTCGTCRNCQMGRRHLCPKTLGIGIHLPGAFAEYLAVPRENIFRIPDTISDEIASIFDPLGNAVHTAFSAPLVSQDVLITGAGPIGLMAVAIAGHAGARSVVITDVNADRLEIAERLGAYCVNVAKVPLESKLEEIHIPHGFSIGMEMSGHPDGLNTLINTSECGGHLALLGILPPHTSVNWNQIIFKGLTLKGIYGRVIFETWYQMVQMLESGLNIDPVITHRLRYDEYQKGFDAMLEGKSGKVILSWE
jgi:threonine 3-dehydrogenase